MRDLLIIVTMVAAGYFIPYSTWSIDRLVLVIPLIVMAAITKGVLDREFP